MLEDLDNWLEVFKRLGASGKILAGYYLGEVSAEDALAAMMKAHTECDVISKAHAALPFQKNPTHVANLVLTPFVDAMAKDIYNRLWISTTGHTAPNASAMIYEFITNVDELKNLQVMREGIYVKLPKVHEPKTLNPGQWIGIRLPTGVNATWIHFRLDSKESTQQGRIQVSTDGGKTWTERSNVRSGLPGDMEIRHIDPAEGINAARYINASATPVSVTLNIVKIDVPADAAANVIETVVDGDLFSGFMLAPHTTLNVPLRGRINETNTRIIAVGPYTTNIVDGGLTISASETPVYVYEVIH
jgi:hypothetical protein